MCVLFRKEINISLHKSAARVFACAHELFVVRSALDLAHGGKESLGEEVAGGIGIGHHITELVVADTHGDYGLIAAESRLGVVLNGVVCPVVTRPGAGALPAVFAGIGFIGAEYENVGNSLDNRKIYVEIALDSRLFRFNATSKASDVLERLVEKGLHATVSSSGVTGLSKLELNFPKSVIEEERISWKPRHIVIPPAPSILESAADSATKILNQLNKMDFVSVWSNLVGVTANANLLLENVNTIVGSQQGNIAEVMDNVRDAASNLRDFSNEIKNSPSLLLRSNDPERLNETR